MEGNLLVSIAGVLLSLGFGYIPGLRDKFGALDGTQKALVMAGLLLAAAVGVFALSCWGPYEYATCDEAGAWKLVELFIAALVANQATYQIAVKPGQG
jgi:uncharacterized membrane protein YbhN (UPF0104 family)